MSNKNENKLTREEKVKKLSSMSIKVDIGKMKEALRKLRLTIADLMEKNEEK
jgi:hypothetical protein